MNLRQLSCLLSGYTGSTAFVQYLRLRLTYFRITHGYLVYTVLFIGVTYYGIKMAKAC